MDTGWPTPEEPEAPEAPANLRRRDRIEVRESGVHGRGVYAVTTIAKGKKIIEYKGEHISWKEALRRHPHDPTDPNHTFYFSLEDGSVIDAKFPLESYRARCAAKDEAAHKEAARRFPPTGFPRAPNCDKDFPWCGTAPRPTRRWWMPVHTRHPSPPGSSPFPR